MLFKDDADFITPEPSPVRKGRFLWMPESDRTKYLNKLREKIATGFYFSDRILSEVVSELAPVIHDSVPREEGAQTAW